MLISHLKKFVFLKTRKTASTSLESYFEKFCMPDGEWVMPVDRTTPQYESETGLIGRRGRRGAAYKDAIWPSHVGASRVRAYLGEEKWNSYFKFSTIRNPYDRMVSYFYWQRSIDGKAIGTLEEEKTQFEQWLRLGNFITDTHIYSIHGRIQLDGVIRYERLQEDLKRICIRLDVPYEPERLQTFGSQIRPPKFNSLTLYTDAGKDIISEHFADELYLFDYHFPVIC